MSAPNVLVQLLTLQNQMKLYHWQTKSYARHKAADKFVTKAIDMIDRIIETYQGKYGRIKLEDKKKVKLDNISDNEIIEFLEKMRDFMYSDFSELLNASNTDLFNLRDEMIESINNTLYLFDLA